MSIAAYEQRLQALESAVADMRLQQAAREAGRIRGAVEDLTLEVDQPLVPAVPPKQLSRLRAKLSGVQPGPRTLGLSQAEWAALNLGDANE